MANRLDLHDELKRILGNENVYYQPPESLEMHYPCIRYQLVAIDQDYANDSTYMLNKAYDLTYITEDPDDPRIDAIASLKMCRFSRHYISDGLHCYVYTIYY